MKRLLTRLATIVAAAPLVVAGTAGTASAGYSVTVPGCFGAGTDQTIVCNVTLSVATPSAELYQQWVKVCVGDCYLVPVTLARPGGDRPEVCYSYTDGAGRPAGRCVNTRLLDYIWINLDTCSATTNVCTYE